jgi:hypothetical protein
VRTVTQMAPLPLVVQEKGKGASPFPRFPFARVQPYAHEDPLHPRRCWWPRGTSCARGRGMGACGGGWRGRWRTRGRWDCDREREAEGWASVVGMLLAVGVGQWAASFKYESGVWSGGRAAGRDWHGVAQAVGGAPAPG